MLDESWQRKINQARWVEAQILKWYQENVDQTAVFPSNHTDKYDIICKAIGNVEVKEDLLVDHTGNYAIEFKNYEGEPSGINVTEAKQFILVDRKHVIIFETESLKYLLNKLGYKKTVDMGYTTPDGKRCRGWLIPQDKILLSPYATVIERWF